MSEMSGVAPVVGPAVEVDESAAISQACDTGLHESPDISLTRDSYDSQRCLYCPGCTCHRRRVH